jgi:hypothetical protein
MHEGDYIPFVSGAIPFLVKKKKRKGCKYLFLEVEF